MKWRDGEWPDDPVGVVILFDRRGNQAGNADPVATHFNRLFPSFGVEIRSSHGLAEFFAEIKNLADFDAAISLQRAAVATRTRIAGSCQPKIRKTSGRKIPRLIDFGQVHI